MGKETSITSKGRKLLVGLTRRCGVVVTDAIK